MSEKTSFEGNIIWAGTPEIPSDVTPCVLIEVPGKELREVTVNMIFQRVRVEILPPIDKPKASNAPVTMEQVATLAGLNPAQKEA